MFYTDHIKIANTNSNIDLRVSTMMRDTFLISNVHKIQPGQDTMQCYIWSWRFGVFLHWIFFSTFRFWSFFSIDTVLHLELGAGADIARTGGDPHRHFWCSPYSQSAILQQNKNKIYTIINAKFIVNTAERHSWVSASVFHQKQDYICQRNLSIVKIAFQTSTHFRCFVIIITPTKVHVSAVGRCSQLFAGN